MIYENQTQRESEKMECCRNMFAGRCETCGRIKLRDGTEIKEAIE